MHIISESVLMQFIKISPCLSSKLQLAKVGSFIETECTLVG